MTQDSKAARAVTNTPNIEGRSKEVMDGEIKMIVTSRFEKIDDLK